MKHRMERWWLVLASLALFATPVQAELLDAINEVRARGCRKHEGGKPPLTRSRQLDRVAEALASGRSLRDAMSSAGYRAVQSATFEATGSDTAIELSLAQRACEDVIDPAYRDIGLASRPNRAWIVLAAPFVAPQPDQAGSVGARVLALVNEARAKQRRCGWRRFHAVPPLLLSETLNRAALVHARDMANHGVLSHTGSDGSAPAERATRAGYRWRFVGENIAAGQPTPEAVVAEWLKSAHHCANLMDPDYSQMGIAFVAAPQSKSAIYWVQMFGTPGR